MIKAVMLMTEFTVDINGAGFCKNTVQFVFAQCTQCIECAGLRATTLKGHCIGLKQPYLLLVVQPV